jgi:hypothetical protein
MMVSEDQSSNCTIILHNILHDNSQRSNNGLLNPIFKDTVSRQSIDEGCIDNNDVECFFSQRVSYKYEMYHSRNYMRCRKTVDFLIRYSYNNSRYNFGEIDCFFEFNRELYAIVYEFDCSAYDFFQNVIFKQKAELENFDQNFLSLYYKINSASTTKRVIKCSDILSKCALVDTNDKQFLIDYLYEREHD